MGRKPDPNKKYLTELEEELKEQYEIPVERGVTSTAKAPEAARVDQLVLPPEKRGKMPFTKDQYVIKENPALVAWERELRLFLRNLTPRQGHRISASMVFEWCTGLNVADLMKQEKRGAPGRPTFRSDLRKLNDLLKQYFGEPGMTHINGRKVARCYRVPAGYYIYPHRPKTAALYMEWLEKDRKL